MNTFNRRFPMKKKSFPLKTSLKLFLTTLLALNADSFNAFAEGGDAEHTNVNGAKEDDEHGKKDNEPAAGEPLDSDDPAAAGPGKPDPKKPHDARDALQRRILRHKNNKQIEKQSHTLASLKKIDKRLRDVQSQQNIENYSIFSKTGNKRKHREIENKIKTNMTKQNKISSSIRLLQGEFKVLRLGNNLGASLEKLKIINKKLIPHLTANFGKVTLSFIHIQEDINSISKKLEALKPTPVEPEVPAVPVDPAKTPVEPAAPAEPAEDPAKTPVEPAVDPAKTPVEPAEVPVEPAVDPVEPSPVDPAEVPAEPAEAPAKNKQVLSKYLDLIKSTEKKSAELNEYLFNKIDIPNYAKHMLKDFKKESMDLHQKISDLIKKIEVNFTDIDGKVTAVNGKVTSINKKVEELKTLQAQKHRHHGRRARKLQIKLKNLRTELQNLRTDLTGAREELGASINATLNEILKTLDLQTLTRTSEFKLAQDTITESKKMNDNSNSEVKELNDLVAELQAKLDKAPHFNAPPQVTKNDAKKSDNSDTGSTGTNTESTADESTGTEPTGTEPTDTTINNIDNQLKELDVK